MAAKWQSPPIHILRLDHPPPQQIALAAIQHEFAPLVVHRAAESHHAGGPGLRTAARTTAEERHFGAVSGCDKNAGLQHRPSAPVLTALVRLRRVPNLDSSLDNAFENAERIAELLRSDAVERDLQDKNGG